jgi:hypothetical protein
MLGTGYHLINPANVIIDAEERKPLLIKKVNAPSNISESPEMRTSFMKSHDNSECPLYLRQTESIK